MSGGSYDYLYANFARQLPDCLKQLQHMLDRLTGLGYAGHAAPATERILTAAESLKRQYAEIDFQISPLSPVWLQVELWDTDKGGSEEALKAALATYNAPERPAETVQGEIDECNPAVIDGNSYLFFRLRTPGTRRTGIRCAGGSEPEGTGRRDLFRVCLKHEPQMTLAVGGQTVVTVTAGQSDAKGVRIVHACTIEVA